MTENETKTKKSATTRASGGRARPPLEIAAEVARQLEQLVGKSPEGITGLERTDDGWTVWIDVLELSRIPSTTDVIATYEVEADASGALQGYRRCRRYVRGTAQEE